jgi:hypothetical protein
MFVLSLLALLPGCAAAPRIETTVSGAIPAGRSFALVAAEKHYGATAALPAATVQDCLASADMARATGRADTLLHLGHAVRPVRARVLVGAEGGAKPRRSGRDREELVLALSDAASGTLLLRASATRTLRRGAAPGDGSDLAAALCAALRPPAPSAGSR